MKERNLGRSGLKVSTLGLGCNNLGGRLDRAASIRVVHAALDLGVTLFDTADVYAMGNRGGSEMVLGEALGARRKDIVLATKFGLPMDDARKQRGGSRRYVMNAVEASLTRLKTDWIDLYQLHVPDRRRRSRRRCAPSTISSPRARSAISAARTSWAGRWSRQI
jgi:aryl-alcohol dehydrogenase-like predicted oxidoreductase